MTADLVLADDGQEHTRECVEMGWWALCWEANCVVEGVPPGGKFAASVERAAFRFVVLSALQVTALLFTMIGGLRARR